MNLIPDKLQRYIKFIGFLIKYWNSDVMAHAMSTANDELAGLESKELPQSYDKPEELVADLKDMGPTWVKLGQLLSTRPDLLPDEYLQALSTLQDDVDEVPYDQILPVLEEELGFRLSKGFESFEEKPLAAASIGQVHRAVLRSGQEVAVKVQRPEIRKKFIEDLDTLKEVVGVAVKHSKAARQYALDDIVEELRHILISELDYYKEAQNLIILGENMQEYDRIVVPKPINGYCTSKVLTMEYFSGQKITELNPLLRTEVDFDLLSDNLVECYLQQIIVDGFAHADPHPGNVHLTADHTIVLMDLGMVAKFSPAVQDKLLRLMIAIGKVDGDAATDTLLSLSEYSEDVNTTKFRRNVNRLVLDNQKYAAKEMKTGKLLIQINRLAAEEGIKIGSDLNILGKILVNLDQIVASLTPEFDLQNSIRKHLEKIFRKKLINDLKPENLLDGIVELKNLARNLPGRIDKISERIANNEFQIKVDAIDEKRFTDGFQKVANRITLGLIIASMIMGAALLMRVPTTFIIWGYPGLAMIFFFGATIAGCALIYTILYKDENYRSKP